MNPIGCAAALVSDSKRQQEKGNKREAWEFNQSQHQSSTDQQNKYLQAGMTDKMHIFNSREYIFILSLFILFILFLLLFFTTIFYILLVTYYYCLKFLQPLCCCDMAYFPIVGLLKNFILS